MATIYVRQSDGNNSDTGLTRHDALRTIPAAEAMAQPGDVIDVGQGRYAGNLTVDVQGLTINGHDAVIDGNGTTAYGIRVLAPWVNIDGFEIRENRTGIVIQTHHVDVTDALLTSNLGHGYYATGGDGYRLENSEISYNVSPRATSGASFHLLKNTGGAEYFGVMIRGNYFHHNDAMGGSDGSGVILDQNNTAGNAPRYYGRTLVQDNEFAWNGRHGFLAFNTDNLHFKYNYAHDNFQNPRGGQDIEVEFRNSHGVRAIGNIAVAERDGHDPDFAFFQNRSSVTWRDNVTQVVGSNGADGVLAIGPPSADLAPSENHWGVDDVHPFLQQHGW